MSALDDFMSAVKLIEDCGWLIVRPDASKISAKIGAMGKSGRFSIQHWDCDLSPIGKCIGDGDDPENTCVFCGDPEERK